MNTTNAQVAPVASRRSDQRSAISKNLVRVRKGQRSGNPVDQRVIDRLMEVIREGREIVANYLHPNSGVSEHEALADLIDLLEDESLALWMDTLGLSPPSTKMGRRE